MSLSIQTFKKPERLCSEKLIAELFKGGNSLYTSHFRILWKIMPDSSFPSPAQMSVSSVKKSFSKAVVRNLLKRRIREAYRQNKHILYEFLQKANIKVAIFIIYRKNNIPDYQTVDNAVREFIQKLILIIQERGQKG